MNIMISLIWKFNKIKGLFYTVLCTLILSISTSTFSQATCDKKVVTANYNAAVIGIDKQIIVLNQALKGEDLGDFAIDDLFGHNFEEKNSEIIIKKLKEQIKKEGVAPEHTSLKNCLVTLGLGPELLNLKEISLARHILRVNLFEKNRDLKGGLKESLEGQSEIPNLKKELSEDKKQSEITKQELEKSLIESESTTSRATPGELYTVDVQALKKTLTKLKIELIDKSLEYNNNLEQKLTYFEDKTRSLSLISSRQNKTRDEVIQSFEGIEELWLEISNENLGQLLKTEIIYDFPTVPEYPLKLVSVKAELKAEILESMQKLRELRKKTILELSEKKEKEFRLLNELVLQTNSLRSRLFERLDFGYVAGRIASRAGIRAIQNEILTSPYRLLSFGYSKYYYVRDKLYAEKEGLVILTRDLFAILFLVGVLFFFNKMFAKIVNWINVKQNPIVKKYGSFSIVKSISSFWNKFKDNAQNVLWLCTLIYMQNMETFRDYILVIDVIKVLIAYRILKSLVILFLSFISKIDYKNFGAFKEKAEITAKKFGNIYLTYNLSLILVHAAIGEVFLFSIIKFLIVVYTIWQVVVASVVWEGEFKKYIERRFSGLIVQKLNSFLSYLPSYVRTVVTFIAIIILSIFDFLIKVTENFEISKKISANLFKKQIENVEATEGAGEKISQEYKDKFAFKSLDEEGFGQYVQFDEKLEKNVLEQIDEWIDERSDEHSLVLYGDKGVGKTTFLKHLGTKVQNDNADLNIIYSKMPSKTLNQKELQSFIVKTLVPPEKQLESFDMSVIDKGLNGKTIVVVDEAQNLFLSQTGGFEAYYFLTEVMNSGTENIYWLMSFNKYSWLYLDRAFARTQFFRNVFELKGWNDINIKELIMKRHSTSDYKLSYDLLISATRSQDEIDKYASIESKFFKLLWELSRGNPRSALSLWISALSRKNTNTFNVNIPREPDITGIDKLSDEIFFILAHVLKHENLSLSELEASTNLPRGIVRNALKVSLERGYLFKDLRNRYMIDINHQHSLTKYLRVKNFIYGN